MPAHGALGVAGLLLIVTAAWFAASWIDTSYDSSCGAVNYPSMWLGDDAPDACRTTMAIRWSISLTVGLVGVFLAYFAAISAPPFVRRNAGRILVVAIATSALLLLVNESVRSDGAL